ncbi:MAG: aminoacyl-tRNA hydrolase [Candidatus Omnitrophica bacterium]|nr:aminoacyl-tRNA hydrolase [Candidatus Omnitrophota bacterium]
MKIIVGLGNPGLIYSGSRHNIGSAIVKSLAVSLKVALKRDNSVLSSVGAAKLGQHNIVLALPRTFMNLSGKAVSALLKKFKGVPSDLLVVCDDLDLELGRMKIRPSGSSGGHRGLVSIIEHLGTQNFSRLRIGIGRPKNAVDAADYVLTGFLRGQRMLVQEVKEDAVNCCLSWAEKGVVETMNMFNTRSRNE